MSIPQVRIYRRWVNGQERFTFRRVNAPTKQPERDFYVDRDEWDSFVNDLVKYDPSETKIIPLVTHDR